MIEVNIPGRRVYRLRHLVVDLNGTLSLDGNMIEGVPERIGILEGLVDVTIVTADTRGRAQELAQGLPVRVHRVDPGDEQAQKLWLVQQLGSEATAAIGNGSNDSLMLKESILGVCVLGPEGASRDAMASCDLVVPDVNAALDLLIKPERLVATLRR